MKVVAIVQARMKSTRLPNKVMKKICGEPLIGILLKRLSKASSLNEIVIATSVDYSNKPLTAYIKKLGFQVMCGSEEDVLSRFMDAAIKTNAEVIVRITADCPLVDPVLIDEAVLKFKNSKVDYLSNVSPPTFPDGLDIEVFTFEALKIASLNARTSYDREHVTPYIRSLDQSRQINLVNDVNYSSVRVTVDELVDLKVVEKIFTFFKPDIYFSWKKIIELKDNNPEIFYKNSMIERNEGMQMNSGQKLWKRAKLSIPGGNMLLSKRPEMFLPDKWPTYFSKSKGCKIWDLDGKLYHDISIMGVGTNILGYANSEVDSAVRKVIGLGNMSTLNCPEEVYLAEKLIELHPWSDMVKFTRSGGEANAVAIRIARAASGKDKVAVCGYHGWHDWYLAANLSGNNSLSGHLLPGLNPLGVPQVLTETVLPFNYGDIARLEEIVRTHEVGVIKMEVARNSTPDINFLLKVREIATKNNIVLIFDECTSGFRQALGGLHMLYDIEPDIAMFGKALGNGYAIAAVIGRRDVMEHAQSTFISSTFWTERIGPTAALKTLEIMERESSWQTITNMGLKIKERWGQLAEANGLNLIHWGLPALAGFNIEGVNMLACKTLITQEMLSKGLLAANSVYVSLAHTEKIIDRYLNELENVFKMIKVSEKNGGAINLLHGKICHDTFKRLN